jgi:hypothetical protein
MPPLSVTIQALNLPEADDLLRDGRGELNDLLDEPDELLGLAPELQAAARRAMTPSATPFLMNPRTVASLLGRPRVTRKDRRLGYAKNPGLCQKLARCRHPGKRGARAPAPLLQNRDRKIIDRRQLREDHGWPQI